MRPELIRESGPWPIVLCITELEPGGAEKICVELATGVDKKLFRPHVIALQSAPSPNRSQLITQLLAHGIYPQFLGARHFAHFPRTVVRLWRRVRQIRPVVMQGFLFHANFIGRLAARIGRVPVVCAGIRVAERSKRWHLWPELLLRELTDRYICVSRAAAAHLMVTCGVPSEKLVVIPNGIDAKACDRVIPVRWSDWGLPANADIILFAGRLDFQKGVDFLLRIAPELVAPQENMDPYLVIIGDGPLARAVGSAVASSELTGRVRYLGWQREPLAFIRAANVVVLPSRWEGMPNVVLEAMACGRPVVAMDVEGVSELLGENVSLQTVPWAESHRFPRQVRTILQNRQLAEELGRKNRERVEREFTVNKMIASYESVWLGCLAQCVRFSKAITLKASQQTGC